ncbi:protein of unknown function [Taphrina deformans PYCC 5710]|uniref:Uncharacterized protein n=1 Tax=Taphrina deformans (strain PYCC 5710 / ATCC 11124 / CBS 356.35 / IMI 108563 / JCM 9778 / NBRC 8474) TaxID=1097556 RepID=R4XHJ9_TAPDE|nr:protein of unknown function [Taphrina deformans PYCC 5710]|eukprot:CCG84003.1 protein of unknown function [Taphrina deformans PYCC 5710]
MPQKYNKISKPSKRVSFDDSARFNFEAPRSSTDTNRNLDSPYHVPEDNKGDSDDEIDNLLAEDPLYEEKEPSRKAGRSGRRLSHKKRRVLIFGMITMLLGLGAALAFVGVHAHQKSHAATQKSLADAKAQMDQASIDEIQGMTEVPSLAGVLPLDSTPSPISPVPVGVPEDEEQIISVPATKIDWDSEEEDKVAWDALPPSSDEPPSLSAEAIAQAQDLNAQLDDASATVASAATDSASKIEAHKGDPLQAMLDSANDFWAWLDAKWDDILGNNLDSDEPIY